MKLSVEQLSVHLQKNLAPIYFVFGDETLLVEESCHSILRAGSDRQFMAPEKLEVNPQFSWTQLFEAANSLSLFNEKTVLDLRMPTGKPGKEGSKALIAYCTNPPTDKLLLIRSGKLDASAQKTKWFQTIASIGVVIPIWPINQNKLPRWLENRLHKKGMRIHPEALQLLIERVEGNLLAADQEVEKLFLLHGEKNLTLDDIQNSVANHSRYNVFVLIDAALQGNSRRVIRIFQALQAEGVEAMQILWALVREIRNLAGMTTELKQGETLTTVLKKYRVWPQRQALISQAVQSRSTKYYQHLLCQCQHLDEILKGARRGNAWDALLSINLALARTPLFRKKTKHDAKTNTH